MGYDDATAITDLDRDDHEQLASSWQTDEDLADLILDAALASDPAATVADATRIWQTGSEELDRAAQKLANDSGDIVCWGATTYQPAGETA